MNCPNCGEDFDKLGLHWHYNESHRVEFSDKKFKILRGILMGDGTINYGDANPRMVIEMVNKEYLNYLDSLLGVHSCGVSIHRTADENSIRGVFSHTGGDYQDTYVLKTRRHPSLSTLSNWYESGNKVFPEKLQLTPLTLKHWYVCDGHYRNGTGHSSIEIGLENESNNRRKINDYFLRENLPEPTWYDSGNSVIIRFTNDQSKEIFEYIGDSIAGFEYKFPQ